MQFGYAFWQSFFVWEPEVFQPSTDGRAKHYTYPAPVAEFKCFMHLIDCQLLAWIVSNCNHPESELVYIPFNPILYTPYGIMFIVAIFVVLPDQSVI